MECKQCPKPNQWRKEADIPESEQIELLICPGLTACACPAFWSCRNSTPYAAGVSGLASTDSKERVHLSKAQTCIRQPRYDPSGSGGDRGDSARELMTGWSMT